MNISLILSQMGIPHKLIGKGDFASLGLVGHSPNIKICSFMENTKYLDTISQDVSVLLVREEHANDIIGKDICIVENPRRVFFEMHNYLAYSNEYHILKYESKIDTSSEISPLASISPQNVIIGKNCIIEEYVSIKENVRIGDNVIIRAGSVIGGEGFEMKRDAQNDLFGVKHTGQVIISDNVEIQYNSCIDKALYPWDQTYIGKNCKIDNLVHIAHAVKIGSNTMIVANSGIGGRVVIGDDVWIGFGSTIRNGVNIGNSARVNMGSVVTKDINAGDAVTGNFAIDHDAFIKNLKQINVN